MKHSLFHYFQVTRQLFFLSQQSAFEYRTDYILRLIRAATDILLVVVVISSLYSHSDSIAGWTRPEALLVYGFYQLITSFVLIFFGFGIDDLPRLIINGRLDSFLLKPIDSQFLVGANIIYITHVYRFISGLIVLIYALRLNPIPASLTSILLTLISLLASLVIFYSLSMGVSTLAFWTFSSELKEIAYTITSTCRLPSSFLPPLIQTVFMIIPLTFIATIPTLALLQKNLVLPLISPLVAAITFLIVRQLWHKGLQSYQSVSS